MNLIPHSKPTLSAADVQAVSRVVRSGALAQGREVERFEGEIARFVGRRTGVAVSSGTAALHLALLALGVGRGHEVMIPSYVCAALLQAVRAAGAKPVLLDIDPWDFSFSLPEIQKKKSARTGAMILPHSFGFPLDMSVYVKTGIPVIEDLAQAVGAESDGRRIGAAGILTVVSFYATKMLTTGEGGMILCDEASLARRLRDTRSYDGKKEDRFAFNYKMTDFQAALGRAQLSELAGFLRRRRALASLYSRALRPHADVLLPWIRRGDHPAYHRFPFRHPRASWLIAELQHQGIHARRPVFKPIHHYLHQTGFPGTETLFKELVSLPIFPSLQAGEARRIANKLRLILRRGERKR